MPEELNPRIPPHAKVDHARPSGWHGYARSELQALIATLLALVLIQGAGPELAAALRYDRADVESGQWWRIVTANVVHYDVRHLAMNAAALVVMWALFVREATLRQWSVIATVSACAVTGGLYAFMPDIGWYVGLSGVLHGLWMAGSLFLWRREGARGVMALGLLLAKLGVEHVHGSLTSVLTSAMPVVPMAHVFGATAGLLALAMRTPLHEDATHRDAGP